MMREARVLSLATTRNSISPVRSSITAGFSGNGIGCAAGVKVPEGGGDSDCDFLMRLWEVLSAESSEALRLEAVRGVRIDRLRHESWEMREAYSLCLSLMAPCSRCFIPSICVRIVVVSAEVVL